jgi:hypothetical protein
VAVHKNILSVYLSVKNRFGFHSRQHYHSAGQFADLFFSIPNFFLCSSGHFFWIYGKIGFAAVRSLSQSSQKLVGSQDFEYQIYIHPQTMIFHISEAAG